MKRHVVILLALTTALMAAMPASAVAPRVSIQAPAAAPRVFGSFDGKVGGGNSGSGILYLVGWALASDGVDAVDIVVDGVINGRAFYGRSRPGVTAAFPGYPDSQHPAFAYQLDTTHFLNGQHKILARVRTKGGATLDLGPKSFEFLNAPQFLQPFGAIQFPNKDAELFGTCGIAPDLDPVTLRDFGDISLLTPRRYNVVSGFVVDPGADAEVDGDGVGYVELLVDGSILYNSVTDCFYSKTTGGMTNCYGIFRPDVAADYPTLKDSVHGGFRFVLDLSQLINLGLYNPGHHTLALRAGDHSGTTINIAEIPVTFSCDDFIGNDASFGFIDIPPNGLTYGGTVSITGWALDFQGVSLVSVLIDGQFLAFATYGLPRPGISTLYPGFPDSFAPGWVVTLDTTKISNGVHHIQAVATDVFGADTVIGERDFTVRNAHQ
jgi:hypothetical protein